MKKVGTIKLHSKRLVLRALKNDDLDLYCIYHYLDNDTRVNKYMRPIHSGIGSNSKLYLQLVTSRYEEPYFFTWGITLKESDIVIGTLEIYNVNKQAKQGEIGFRLAYEFWNHGYMSEALARVLEFAFKEVGFAMIIVHVNAKNIAAQKVASKQGFVHIHTYEEIQTNTNTSQILKYELSKHTWLECLINND